MRRSPREMDMQSQMVLQGWADRLQPMPLTDFRTAGGDRHTQMNEKQASTLQAIR
ncbi:hypothetical protein [Laceyella tengchongensis]|uniref:Uncharacterized protein n=1 Tax=Laceyella tengchongensis TaxID=574699 RepID=A0AA45WMC7_9BACL|nr:hypothetical protein [Laceyella tengchongensis]MRG27940.1 hypothetical protein [Laceyella tengchongensis]SMP13747.1 hypothetical protein SAMN06265361_102500 [Laceyella tengchongensis]